MRSHRFAVAAITCLSLGLGLGLGLPTDAASASPALSSVLTAPAKATLTAPATAAVGSKVTFAVRFPSTTRVFTIVADWGDGSAPSTVRGSSSSSNERAKLTHSFKAAGTFIVTVTVGRLKATRTIVIADDASPSAAAEEWQLDMLAQVNAVRAKVGVRSVGPCTILSVAATKHSADMAARGYFEHTGLDGRKPTDRAAAEGYGGGVGENIAAGQENVAEVMKAWINSPGHYANLIYADYQVVGFGRVVDPASKYRTYWTQNFGIKSC